MQPITPPYMPPAEAPNPILTESDVVEPPLPPVTQVPSSTPGDDCIAMLPGSKTSTFSMLHVAPDMESALAALEEVPENKMLLELRNR
ncbi:Glycerophosphodiester phosphodiesterase [Melia azedarach]|uniref:Glycerophosphodiester phosphodiesterase n=1 Tax=Melia azedarach TaxID=155640 RepID=A0ACC1YPS1_MELAZ|nr:Glycerophosphodiester phosphodiesterase [Melia azedarach]